MIGKSKLQLGLLCLALFITGAFYMNSQHDFIISQRAMSQLSEGVHQGEMALPISLKNVEGELIHLEDFAEKKVILFFFTSWCEICSEQWVELATAEKEGLLDDIQIVAINLTDAERGKEDVLQYIQNIPLKNVEILIDEAGVVQERYQVLGVPTSLLLNKGHVIETRGHFIPYENMKNSSFFIK